MATFCAHSSSSTSDTEVPESRTSISVAISAQAMLSAEEEEKLSAKAAHSKVVASKRSTGKLSKTV